MPRKGIYILIVSLAAVAAMLVACSGGLSEEDVEERAQELAKEMAVGGMTEADVEKRAMEMAEEMRSEFAMMPKGERLQAVKDRGRVICASRNDVPGYGFDGSDAASLRRAALILAASSVGEKGLAT